MLGGPDYHGMCGAPVPLGILPDQVFGAATLIKEAIGDTVEIFGGSNG